jgi:hypothetical protein
MPRLLNYSRSRSTSVELIDENTMRSICRLTDRLRDMTVELTVKLPDLEIVDALGRVGRAVEGDCVDTLQGLKNVVGVRIGPSMTRIINGSMGEDVSCPQLVFMVEECCHGVILAFTKDTLASVPEDQVMSNEFYRGMVEANIRLYNRCAAFAPGSSLVAGIKPPE